MGPRGSPRTLAMWGYWRGVANTGNEARVEATQDSWYWGAPLPDCTFNAAVFMDASSERNDTIHQRVCFAFDALAALSGPA